MNKTSKALYMGSIPIGNNGNSIQDSKRNNKLLKNWCLGDQIRNQGWLKFKIDFTIMGIAICCNKHSNSVNVRNRNEMTLILLSLQLVPSKYFLYQWIQRVIYFLTISTGLRKNLKLMDLSQQCQIYKYICTTINPPRLPTQDLVQEYCTNM